MAHGDFKDLKRRTASDKVLGDIAFDIAKNPKYDGYQRGLAFMVYEELHKLIINTFKKEQFIQNLKTISGVWI